MQYIRLGPTYLILATRGRGRFFEDEGKAIRDAARYPIKFAGYSVGYQNDRVRVRIEEKAMRRSRPIFSTWPQAARRRPWRQSSGRSRLSPTPRSATSSSVS
jgi:hypothetical protein